jgi:hypothetical protein
VVSFKRITLVPTFTEPFVKFVPAYVATVSTNVIDVTVGKLVNAKEGEVPDPEVVVALIVYVPDA